MANNKPFPEMEGNIVFVDYELSSWKYQNENDTPSKYLAYILGEQPLPTGGKIHIKSGNAIKLTRYFQEKHKKHLTKMKKCAARP